MSEIDPEKILAELDAARLAQQRESLPVRHRGLLVAVAVVITLLLLALFAFSLLPGGGNRPAEPSATAHLGEGRNFSFALLSATS